MKVLRLIIAIGALVLFLYYQNNFIEVTDLKLVLSGLPKGFGGYKIVHLSDLHGKVFGRDNKILISKIKREKPDLIVITGDLIAANASAEKDVLTFLSEIVRYAPVYYVTGNHEMLSKKFSHFEQQLKEKGINMLRNSNAIIKRNGYAFLLAGVDDPGSDGIWSNSYCRSVLEKELKVSLAAGGGPYFKILLAHRPEQFPLYIQNKANLIFAGHAHGGQIRIPFIGGLVAPNQGFFPKYTSGKYIDGDSTMVVNRGLGNGSIPIRIFNRPEIVSVTLHSG